MPLSATFCGLSAALSVRVRLALREPVAPGVKVTLMVQLAFAARLLGQLLVWAKSPLFVPVNPMLVIFRGTVPVSVSFTAAFALVVPTFWLPKLTLVGLRLTTGIVVVPVPLRATFWGLFSPLSVNVRLALRLPLAVGVKVTLTVQL